MRLAHHRTLSGAPGYFSLASTTLTAPHWVHRCIHTSYRTRSPRLARCASLITAPFQVHPGFSHSHVPLTPRLTGRTGVFIPATGRARRDSLDAPRCVSLVIAPSLVHPRAVHSQLTPTPRLIRCTGVFHTSYRTCSPRLAQCASLITPPFQVHPDSSHSQLTPTPHLIRCTGVFHTMNWTRSPRLAQCASLIIAPFRVRPGWFSFTRVTHTAPHWVRRRILIPGNGLAHRVSLDAPHSSPHPLRCTRILSLAGASHIAPH